MKIEKQKPEGAAIIGSDTPFEIPPNFFSGSGPSAANVHLSLLGTVGMAGILVTRFSADFSFQSLDFHFEGK
jgi:hypothetical protein